MSVTKKQKELLRIAVDNGKVFNHEVRKVYVSEKAGIDGINNLVGRGFLKPNYGSYLPTQEAINFLKGLEKPKKDSRKEYVLPVNKPYWAIVQRGDPNGYHTGKAFAEVVLVQDDLATPVREFLADGSVEAGESGGDYYFTVLHKHPSNLHIIADQEE